MNGSYLIAFNQKIRQIELDQNRINVDPKGKEELQYIDLVTSIYTKDELRKGLLKKGITESYDTPIYIAKLASVAGKPSVELYKLVTKEDISRYEHSYNLFDIFKEFHTLYLSDNEFRLLANYFMDEYYIGYIFKKYGDLDRAFVPNYYDARKMQEILDVFKKYHTLDEFKQSTEDYHNSKGEIISLLSPQYNL